MNILVFWLSLAAIFYSYLGYPALMWLLAFIAGRKRGRGKKSGGAAYTPAVSLIISAYNEEDVIEKKLRNAADMRYPKDLLEIIVASDGSDDRTDEIVKGFSGVSLRRFEGRIGKTACLNRVVPEATGDIIVFSDANSMYEKNAISSLVENFADERVGFATGFTKYAAKGSGDAAIGLYALLEKLAKVSESRIGSCAGADGAIFAIRKRLYRPLDGADINDLVIPLNIVRSGYRGVLDERAFCTEEAADGSGAEFFRQVRIANRTLRAVFRNSDLLNPFRHGIFAFEFFSHKVCKLSVPFFILGLLFSNAALAAEHWRAYGGVFAAPLLAQAALGLLGWIGRSGEGKTGLFSRISSLSHSFLAVNLAVLLGWLKFLRGENFITWAPARR